MPDYDIYLDDPFVRHKVDSLGRTRIEQLQPGDDPVSFALGLGGTRRFPHPAYALGYAMAVSYEYQMILIDFFNPNIWGWPSFIEDLKAGLSFPPDDVCTDSYQGMVAYESAIAESVQEIRPELAESLATFAALNGLDALPWGLGWLYRKVPGRWTNEVIEVPVTLPSIPLERPGTDPRQTPALDALLLYLWLTGGWRDEGARDILSSVACFKCDIKRSPECPMPICFASGNVRPEGLKLRVKRIRAALGIQRRGGRPRGFPLWGIKNLHIVLTDYVHCYGAVRREIANHF